MPEFTSSEAKTLARYVKDFAECFQREVDAVLTAQFRGFRPPAVDDLLGQLALLERQLLVRQKPVRVHDLQGPLLNRVLVDQRRRIAEDIDGPLQRAADQQVISALKRELYFLEALMDRAWFHQVPPLRLPALTDYLSIRHAEAAMPGGVALRSREYDEKFHILEAPSLFLPDLAHYRRRCRFRGLAVSVAFMDIDDFKAFNTRYTETTVDLEVLGPLMEAIEAHVFCHGHAYRFGGDEYVLTLPNQDRTWAGEFLRGLQARVARTPYGKIRRAPTLSVGLCTIDPDCYLTDREVLARANEAKNFAKSSRKGSIATYQGGLFRAGDLVLV